MDRGQRQAAVATAIRQTVAVTTTAATVVTPLPLVGRALRAVATPALTMPACPP
jgi:hypothetical protein